jgi:hypothetical protein
MHQDSTDFNKLLKLICGMPGLFLPVEVRQTGMREAIYGAREEAYSRADREPAAAG